MYLFHLALPSLIRSSESVFKGWQLLCVLLITFPPSKNFETYLRSFIQGHLSQREGRVDVMAKFNLRRLDVISKKGPRGKPPTVSEIETASVRSFTVSFEAQLTLVRMPPSIPRPLGNPSMLSFVCKSETIPNKRFPSFFHSLQTESWH